MWSDMGSQFKNPFRFEQVWMEHLDFDEKIKMWWEELSGGHEQSMYKFQ